MSRICWKAAPTRARLSAKKADQLRVYSGSKFRLVSEAWPGDVVAVTGLSAAYPGQGLGARAGRRAAGAGTGAELPPAAAGRGRRARRPARAAHAGSRRPAAACRLAGNAGRSAPAADGRSAAGNFAAAYCRTVSASRLGLTKAAFCIKKR